LPGSVATSIGEMVDRLASSASSAKAGARSGLGAQSQSADSMILLIQRQMQKMSTMMQLLSGIAREQHDTAMNAIRNMR